MYVYQQFDVESHLNGRLKIAYFNTPESMNALTKPLLSELRDFVEFYNKDKDTRCIVIAARGKAFCSGQNLASIDFKDPHVNVSREVQRMVIDYYNPLVSAIHYSKNP